MQRCFRISFLLMALAAFRPIFPQPAPSTNTYLVPLCAIALVRADALAAAPGDNVLSRQVLNQFGVSASDWGHLVGSCRKLKAAMIELAHERRSRTNQAPATQTPSNEPYEKELAPLVDRTMAALSGELSPGGKKGVASYLAELQKNSKGVRLGK